MDILDALCTALETERTVMLATIIATSGSTPAPALSRMLIGEPGDHSLGTVGGGCVEGDIIDAGRRLRLQNKGAVLTFRLDEEHPESGMTCGGSLDVLIEPLGRDDRPMLEELRQARDGGESSIRVTVLGGDGTVRDRAVIVHGALEQGRGERGASRLLEKYPQIRATLVHTMESLPGHRGTERIPLPDGEIILEMIAGAPALFIFGGGHIARHVSRIASAAGFRVTVVDDRKEFANPVRFPEAVQTIAMDFRRSFTEIRVKHCDSIVIVTRGHKSDDDVLEEALRTPASYIGMIGSTMKVGAAFERLRANGVSGDALRQVRAPIGIDIGAVTPEEIAVSIVAELIHARRVPGSPLRFKHSAVRR